MPNMDWEAFQQDHYRPHLLIVRIEPKRKSTPAVVKANFERLAVILGASGNYAFKTQGTNIHAAFEDDEDAALFAAVLRPTETTRESAWPSKALARMDDSTYRRIAAILRQSPRKKTKRR